MTPSVHRCLLVIGYETATTGCHLTGNFIDIFHDISIEQIEFYVENSVRFGAFDFEDSRIFRLRAECYFERLCARGK